MLYDSQGVQFFFDNYGTREWDRREQTLQGRFKYAIHRRFLDACVPEGARLRDAGGGPGRFARDLALCNRPGLVDTREHLLAVAGKP